MRKQKREFRYMDEPGGMERLHHKKRDEEAAMDDELEDFTEEWEATCLDCHAVFTGRVHPLDEVCVKCGSARVRRSG